MNNVRALQTFTLQELSNGILGADLVLVFLSNQGSEYS